MTPADRVLGRYMAGLGLCLLCACSVYMPIRITNSSDAPVTLTYKIQPLGWNGLFHEDVLLRDRSVYMNKADSVVTLILQPGEDAVLGEGFVSRKARPLQPGDTANCPSYERGCMNLYWMRITQSGIDHLYTPEELIKALRARRIPITLTSEDR